MYMKRIFTSWQWSASIGCITILSFWGLKIEKVKEFIGQFTANDVAQYFLLLCAVFFFLKAVFLKQSGHNVSELALKEIAAQYCQKGSANYGVGNYFQAGGIPLNDTWKEWIKRHLIPETERTELEAHNFGDFYYLYDLVNGNKIKIPTDKTARESVIAGNVRLGTLYRVMPKID